MELENKKLARKFADTIDRAYELWRDQGDKAFRKKMKDALRDFYDPYLCDL